MKKKPIISVAVTDGNGSLGAVFSGTGTPKATFTIREDDVLLERTYVLPKREEGQTDDELAVVRDVFVLNRWKELVTNYFPGLVGMPGGPDLDICEHCGQPVPVFVTPLDDEGNPNGATEAVEGVRSVSVTEAGREFADAIRTEGEHPSNVSMTAEEAVAQKPLLAVRITTADGMEVELPSCKLHIHEETSDDEVMLGDARFATRQELTSVNVVLEAVPFGAAAMMYGFSVPEDKPVDLHVSVNTGQRTGRTQRLLEGRRG